MVGALRPRAGGAEPRRIENNRGRGKVADDIGALGQPHRGARYRRKTPDRGGDIFARAGGRGRGALAPIRPTVGRAAANRPHERRGPERGRSPRKGAQAGRGPPRWSEVYTPQGDQQGN